MRQPNPIVMQNISFAEADQSFGLCADDSLDR